MTGLVGCSGVRTGETGIELRVWEVVAVPVKARSGLPALLEAFPDKKIQFESRPHLEATQTTLFGDISPKPGEVDFVVS